MKNKLSFKNYPVRKLKIGQSCIVGPYNASASVSSKLNYYKQHDPENFGKRTFVQKQMILMDITTLQGFKMYIITRTN